MRVPRPMRRGLPQLIGEGRGTFLHDFGRRGEEPLHHPPQSPRGNPVFILSKAAYQRGRWMPLRRRHGQPPLNEVAIEGGPGQRRQHDLAGLVALADDPEPGVAVRVRVDRGQSRTHEFADSQARGVGEVQHEAQPLCGRLAPAVGPLQTVGDDPDELPLVLGEGVRRVELRRPAASHLDAGEWVGQHVALLDEPSVQGVEYRQRVGCRARREVAREGAPRRRRPWLRCADPARARARMTQEGAVGNGVLGGQRRKGPPALDDRPQDQPLGLLAVGPLGRRRLVQRQPGVHGLVVVAGVERTAGPRRSEGAP